MAACGVAVGGLVSKELEGVHGGRGGVVAGGAHELRDAVEGEVDEVLDEPRVGMDEDDELAAQIAQWEAAAAGDYAGVGFDDTPDAERERVAREAARFEPGSASLPGMNLYENDVPLADGELPAPPAEPLRPAHLTAPSTPAKPGAPAGISDADYRAWKAQAQADYPQPDDDDVQPRPAPPPQTARFRPKF